MEKATKIPQNKELKDNIVTVWNLFGEEEI